MQYYCKHQWTQSSLAAAAATLYDQNVFPLRLSTRWRSHLHLLLANLCRMIDAVTANLLQQVQSKTFWWMQWAVMKLWLCTYVAMLYWHLSTMISVAKNLRLSVISRITLIACTARCTYIYSASAVLLSYVVRPSVRPWRWYTVGI